MNLEHLAKWLLPPVQCGSSLAGRELSTLARVADAILQGAPHEIASEQVAANVDRFLVIGHSRRAWRVRILLELIEFSTLPSHARRFSKLPLDARTTLLQRRWIGGRGLFRVYAKARNLVLVGAYGDKTAAAACGYVPVPQRPRFQRLRVASPQELL